MILVELSSQVTLLSKAFPGYREKAQFSLVRGGRRWDRGYPVTMPFKGAALKVQPEENNKVCERPYILLNDR